MPFPLRQLVNASRIGGCANHGAVLEADWLVS